MSELIDKAALRDTVQKYLSEAEESLKKPVVDNQALRDEIKTLLQEKDAALVAHYY